MDILLQYLSKTEPSSDANSWFDEIAPVVNGIWALAPVQSAKKVKDSELKDRTASTQIHDQSEQIASHKIIDPSKGKAPISSLFPVKKDVDDHLPLYKLLPNRIYFLTPEQMKIWSTKEKFVTLCGPAGTGKTILLLGKIIEFCRNPNNSALNCVVLAADPMDIKVNINK